MTAPYEVYAIRYARHEARTARQNFIASVGGGDEHDGGGREGEDVGVRDPALRPGGARGRQAEACGERRFQH